LDSANEGGVALLERCCTVALFLLAAAKLLPGATSFLLGDE
jgi:hypothetical protein